MNFLLFCLSFLVLSGPFQVFTMTPFIYDISNDRSHFDDSDSSNSLSKNRNVTASSTGGTKLLIFGYGFSQNSALGNKILIDHTIECDVVTYYTTPNQIQCIVPPYDKIGVPLDITLTVDNTQTAIFYGSFAIHLVYIYDPSLLVHIRPINAPIDASTLNLEVLPSIDTAKGQVFQISIGDYLCTPVNPTQKLSKDVSNLVACTLPEITIPDYYPLNFLIKNGGGLLVNANSSRQVVIQGNTGSEYQVSFHPVISSISSAKGAKIGSFLSIAGKGFMAPLTVRFMGQDLQILTFSSTSIYLQMPQINTSETGDLHSGNIGCDELIFNKVYQFKDRELLATSQKPDTQKNLLFLNPQPNSGTKGYTRLVKGLFRAPFTNMYRFYCSGVERSKFFMSNVSSSSNRKMINEICGSGPSAEDDYFNDDKQVSDWISLQQGSLYYFEWMHINAASDNDSLKVGVEIKASNDSVVSVPIFAHPHDLQILEISAQFVPETLLIVLSNLDTLRSALVLRVGEKISPKLDLKLSAADLATALQAFFGTKVNITMTYSDQQEKKVADFSLAININLTLFFTQGNRANFSIIPDLMNSSLVSYDTHQPTNWSLIRLQVPSNPINGTFKLSLNGVETPIINLTSPPRNITQNLMTTFGFLQSPVIVKVLNNTMEKLSYSIEFRGNPGAMPLLVVNTSDLTGGAVGQMPNVTVWRKFEGNSNLFINPVSEELLSSARLTPEVTVISNNVSSICNSSCVYSLISPNDLPVVISSKIVDQVLVFELVNVTKAQAFVNVSLDEFDVLIGTNQYCPNNGLTLEFHDSTNNTATLNCSFGDGNLDLFYAGDFLPKVMLNSLGFLSDQSSNVPKISIPLVISSISPINGSTLGGTLLNIIGQGFPMVSGLVQLSVSLGSSQCLIVDFDEKNIQCRLPNGFYNTDSTENITINVGNQSSGNYTFSRTTANTPSIKSFNINTMNPWTANTFQITLNNADNTSNISIFFKSQSSNTVLNCSNPTLNSSTGIAQCIFYQKSEQLNLGNFDVLLYIDSMGLAGSLNSQTNQFELPSIFIGCKVSKITPNSGALTGGSLVSVYGEGFAAGLDPRIDAYACLVVDGTLNSTFFQCQIQNLALLSSFSASFSIFYKNKQISINSTSLIFSFLSSQTPSSDTKSFLTSSYSSGDYLQPSITSYKSIITQKMTVLISFSLDSDPSFTPVTISAYAYTNGSINLTLPYLSPQTYTLQINIQPLGFLNMTQSKIQIVTSCSALTPTKGPPKGNIVSLTVDSLPQNFSLYMKLIDGSLLNMSNAQLNGNQITFRVPTLIASDKYKVLLFDSQNQTLCSNDYQVKADLTSTAQIDNIELSNGVAIVSFCVAHYTSNDPSDYLLINSITNETIQATSTTSNLIVISVTFRVQGVNPGIYLPSVMNSGKGLCEITYISSSTPKQVTLTPQITGLVFNMNSSFGGGNYVKIQGLYLYSNPVISICHLGCNIIATSGSEIKCQIPSMRTVNLLQNHTELMDQSEDLGSSAQLFSDQGSSQDWEKVRDQDQETYFTANASSCVIGYDFGVEAKAVIKEVGLSLYGQWNSYNKFLSTSVEASQDNQTWTTLFYLTNINDNMNYYTVYKASSTLTAYRFIRFNDLSSNTQCKIREFRVLGVLVNKDSAMSSCPLKLSFSDSPDPSQDYLASISSQSKTINFKEEFTPLLLTFLPRYLLAGVPQRFSTMTMNAQAIDSLVFIEDNPCPVTEFQNAITCTYTANPDDFNGKIRLSLRLQNSFGIALNLNLKQNDLFLVQRWSNSSTWAGKEPTSGASLLIPQGQAVLLDESPPPLKMLMVEGVLLASDEVDMELVVEKLVVRRGGSFIVGFLMNDYLHRFTLTLRQLANSSNDSLEDDVTRQYFSKVLSVYGGTLIMKGVSRGPRYCKLKTSALKNDQTVSIDITPDSLWKKGDKVMFSGSENSIEEAYLAEDFNYTLKVLKLTQPLQNDHLCVQSVNGISLCPEVFIITTNVIIQGDPNQIGIEKSGGYMIVDGYGGVLNLVMMKQVLFKDMGQSLNLGASPLFYREVTKLIQTSNFIRNTFVNCYNRGIALQSSNNVRLSSNVIYFVYGHGISTVHGTESGNIINNNLIVSVRKSIISSSWTDYYCAGVFLSNPANQINNNIVSASKNSGFYLYFDTSAEGVYLDSICPSNTPIKIFTSNEAHHIGTNALQLDTYWNGYQPLTYTCQSLSSTNVETPVVFNDFKAWQVQGFGGYFDKVGQFQLSGFICVNCKGGGVIFGTVSLNDSMIQNFRNMDLPLLDAPLINNSIFMVDNSVADYASSSGILLPPSEGLVLTNLQFSGYKNGGTIFICSNCDPNNDPGQHLRLSNISILNSTKIFSFHQNSRNAMILDFNGNLSNKSNSQLLLSRTTQLLSSSACEESNNPALNATVIVCPILPDRGLLDCSLFNMTADKSIDPTKLSLQVTNVGLDAQSLQKSTLTTNVSQPSVSSYQTLSVLNPYSTAQWRFFLFTGINFDLEFSNKPAFNSIKFQCNGWKPGFQSFFVKLHYYQGNGMTITQNSQTDNQVSQTLTETFLFSPNDITNFYTNLDRNIVFLKLSPLLMTTNFLNITKKACSGSCCDAGRECEIRLWSAASTWTGLTAPSKGVSLNIPYSYRILLDVIPDTLDQIILDGELILDEMLKDSDLSFNTLFIRQGRLKIGRKEKPFPFNANIKIVGDRSSTFMSLSEKVQKAIVVTGQINAYGMGRNFMKSRLLEIAKIGSSSLKLVDSVDWNPNDEVFLINYESQSCGQAFKILSITLNQLSLNSSLTCDHFGSQSPTYKQPTSDLSLDIRSQLILLTRNIQFLGLNSDLTSNQSFWGGSLKVINFNSSSGSVQLSNIAVSGFGKSTMRSAGYAPIITDSAFGFLMIDRSSIINCSIVNNFGPGMNLDSTTNLNISSNFIANSLQYGIKTSNSSLFTLSDNEIWGSSFDYSTLTTKEQISIGLFININSVLNASLTTKDNRVSFFGVGFSVPAGFCNNNSISLQRNSAFSNFLKGFLFFFPDSNCSSISSLTAYKNQEGVYSFYSTATLFIKDLILASNTLGLNANKATSKEDSITTISSSTIIGQIPIFSQQICLNFTGIQLPITLEKAKAYPADLTMFSNWDYVDFYTNFNDKTIITNLSLVNFSSFAGCSVATLFRTNRQASDSTAPTVLSQLSKSNSKGFTVSSFDLPSPSWISPKFCGESQCSGLYNVLVKDLDGTLLGAPGVLLPKETNEQFIPAFQCQEIGSNSLSCDKSSFSMFLIDSLDKDKMSRSLAPVYLENQAFGLKKTLNGFMDHFYNMYSIYSFRYNRFPSVVSLNTTYNLSFAQAAAVRTRVKLSAALPNDYLIVRMNYEKNQVKKLLQISHFDNNTIIPNMLTVNRTQSLIPLTCGANFIDPDFQFVEFVLTGVDDCELLLTVTNSLICELRLDQDIDTFSANISNFMTHLSQFLGLHSDRLKSLNLSPGSSIISFSLLGSAADVSESDLNAEKQELLSYLTKLKQGLVSGSLDLGVNVMRFNYTTSFQSTSSVISQGSGDVINEAGTVDLSIVINKPNGNTNNLPANNTAPIPVINNATNDNSSNISNVSNTSNITNQSNSSNTQNTTSNNSNTTKNTSNNASDIKTNEIQQSNSKDDNTLKIGLIVGVVLVVGVALLIGLVCCRRWRKMRKNSRNYSANDLEVVSKYYERKK